jgi:hypothetical protein
VNMGIRKIIQNVSYAPSAISYPQIDSQSRSLPHLFFPIQEKKRVFQATLSDHIYRLVIPLDTSKIQL